MERFYQYVQNPVCFIRTVSNQREIQYICEQTERIQNIVMKWNSKSCIVFIFCKGQEAEEIGRSNLCG
ncbi:MAG: hypothetical protein IJO85_11945 [Lachnospiraceae bacterium]|nr:hypothetical protein [Lachnospiraceae bacterium]